MLIILQGQRACRGLLVLVLEEVLMRLIATSFDISALIWRDTGQEIMKECHLWELLKCIHKNNKHCCKHNQQSEYCNFLISQKTGTRMGTLDINMSSV